MNIGAWVKAHKPEAALGGAGLGATLYLAYRQRKAAAAAGGSSTAATTAANASYAMPQSTADTTQSDAFSGIEDQVVGLQSALLALQNPAAPAAPTTPAPATPAAAAAPAQVGFGEVDTSQGPMDWLGVWGQPIYQVGGGAPVYFGNATTLAQGNPMPGQDVYTPVANSGLVSAKPS
jgi:hypothetical protein